MPSELESYPTAQTPEAYPSVLPPPIQSSPTLSRVQPVDNSGMARPVAVRSKYVPVNGRAILDGQDDRLGDEEPTLSRRRSSGASFRPNSPVYDGSLASAPPLALAQGKPAAIREVEVQNAPAAASLELPPHYARGNVRKDQGDVFAPATAPNGPLHAPQGSGGSDTVLPQTPLLPHQQYHPSPPRASKPWVLFVPFVILACTIVFIVTMGVNNCPSNSVLGNCALGFLGRFSFEPLSVNPLLGPTSATLLSMGALESSVIQNGQAWRLLTSMWLHAGVFHILANMLGLAVVGWKLESDFGAIRTGIVYFISGIGGALLSTLFLANTISVGASGALFGLLGATLSELITNWSIYANKWSSLITLIIIIAINLLFGLMPLVDNFCHIGGLLAGFLLGFILFVKPHWGWIMRGHWVMRDPETGVVVTQETKETKYKPYQYVLQVCSFFILLIGLVAAFAAIFSGVDANKTCSWCHYFSCINTPLWSCDGRGGTPVQCETTTYSGNNTIVLGCPNGSSYSFANANQISTDTLQQLCASKCG